MPLPDTILELTESLLACAAPHAAVRRAAHQFWAGEGTDPGQVRQAVRIAADPNTALPLAQALIQVCSFLLEFDEEPELIGQVHAEFAQGLRLRVDPFALKLSVCHFDLARSFLRSDSDAFAWTLVKEAEARCRLAELGVDPVENPQLAILACRRGRDLFPAGSPGAAEADMVEGAAHAFLARIVVDRVGHLRHAIERFAAARSAYDLLEPGSLNAGAVRNQEAIARAMLGALGCRPVVEYTASTRLFWESVARYGRTTHEGARGLTNVALNAVQLARLGETPLAHLNEAIELLAEAGPRLDPREPNYGMSRGRMLVNEAMARIDLTNFFLAAPLDNLMKAAANCDEAVGCFTPGSPDAALALKVYADALATLRNFGFRTESALDQAVERYDQASAAAGPETTLGRTARFGSLQARLERLNQSGAEPGEYDQLIASIRHLAAGASDDTAVSLAAWLLLAAALQSRARASSRHDRVPAALRSALAREDRREAVRSVETALTFGRPGSPDHTDATLELARALLLLVADRPDPGGLQAAGTHLAKLRAGDRLTTAQRVEFHHLQSRVAWYDGDYARAYGQLTSALGLLDRRRAAFRSEAERTRIDTQYSHLYAGIVDVCAELATEGQTGVAIWDGWYWVQRGKNRGFWDLWSAEPTTDRPPAAADYYSAVADFDRLTRELAWIDSQHGIPQPNPVLLDFAGPVVVEDRTDGLGAIQEGRTHLHHLLEEAAERLRACEEQLDSGTGQWAYPPAVFPALPALQRSLADYRTDPSAGERQLVIDLYLVGRARLVVHLLTLWRDTPPVALVIELDPAAFTAACEQVLRPNAAGGSSPFLTEVGAIFEAVHPLIERWQPTRITVATHGLTGLLPVHAATVAGRALVDWAPVNFVPSSGLVGTFRGRRKPPGRRALVVGDPRGDLPLAAREARAVDRALKKQGLDPLLLLGADATVAAVREQGRTASIIHLAAHATLDPTAVDDSGIELADGRWRVRDLLRGDRLDAASLVTVGCCHGARDTFAAAEQLTMMRAFMLAGANAVVAALWPVEDAAGQAFAELLYHHWRIGEGPLASGYRSAVLAARDLFEGDWRSWSPYVLFGDPDPVTSRRAG